MLHTVERPRRAERYTNWVDSPLNIEIRAALEEHDWNLSDLGRATGRAPSLIARWMAGQRPSVDSLRDIAQALGLSFDRLMMLAGYRDDDPGSEEDDIRKDAIIAKVRLVELTDESYAYLDALLEAMRRRRMRRAVFPVSPTGPRPPQQ